MLSQPARVHLRLQRFARGRKVHGSCVKRRRSAARHRRCRRLVPVGHTTVRGEPGRTIVRFGRLSRHRRLNPGRYRLTARSGRSASTRAVTFRTVAR